MTICDIEVLHLPSESSKTAFHFGMVGHVVVNMSLITLQLPGTNTFQIKSVVTTKVDSRPGFPHPTPFSSHPTPRPCTLCLTLMPPVL